MRFFLGFYFLLSIITKTTTLVFPFIINPISKLFKALNHFKFLLIITLLLIVYENESLKEFKEKELNGFKSEINQLRDDNELLKSLVAKNDQIIDLQFKRIAKLEEKLKK